MTLQKFTQIQGIKGQIITELVPMINQITDRTRKSVEAMSIEKTGVSYYWTEFDTYCTQVGAIADLMKAMANYLNNDDQLITMSATEGIKGIEISIDILRGGSSWNMITTAIWAGGYNIVREHTRYIVNTNLPRKKSDFAAEFIAEEKKAKKLTDLQKTLSRFEQRLQNAANELAANLEKTDAEIIEELKEDEDKKWIFELTIEDSKFTDLNEFNQFKAEAIAKDVEFWKTRNIEWNRREVKDMTQAIKRTKQGIEKVK